jgi:sterol desaturase/sphingolipid hydroxylase (fatty acid hydroxylase superfamily)
MNANSFIARWKKRNFSELECYAVFLFLFSPVIYVSIRLEQEFRSVFHLCLFIGGFFLFTFLEYIAHRFWMHGKEDKHPGKSLERHMHHHRHPTELKITSGFRAKLVVVNILLFLITTLLNNYFTLFTGLYTGFVYYCFLHVFLHQAWAKKVFPRLQVSHIHHHCKYPDHCFSTCVTWWDQLFNTSVPKEVKISGRIVAFYFGKSGH